MALVERPPPLALRATEETVSHRDEIIRSALHAIDEGENVSQAIADAVDAALEYGALNALNAPDNPVREYLTKEKFIEAAFLIATRRQVPGPGLPPKEDEKKSWWKL